MTTSANADDETELHLPGDGQEVEVERTPTEHILTGQEGDEVVDSAEVEAAMAAGWKKVDGTAPALKQRAEETDITDVVTKEVTDQGNEGTEQDPATNASSTTPPPDDDPDIPGLGMKASAVKAALGRLDALEKSTASTAGHLGHLKQLVSQAGKGKAVTAEALSNVAEEFGPEFAAALAKDLSSAGFGSGATVDPSAIEAMVSEQVAQASEATRRTLEKKAVLRTHKDADEHFAQPVLDKDGKHVMTKDANGNDVPTWKSGAKHTAFMSFVGTLPLERQQELNTNGWDADVVIRALDDFKAHEKKVAKQQTTQSARVNRAVAPTSAGGSRAVEPTVDPMEQGWRNVRGNARAGRAASGARR